MDKTEILEILNDWNYWNKVLPETIERPVYEEKLVSLSQLDEVIVITGVRRCGKSTLMLNRIKQLLKEGVSKESILFVNLEDPRFINVLDTGLLEKIKEVYLENLNPQGMVYVFLDEVQNVENWEKWVTKEYEFKRSKMVISGSNSSMLSSEIGSSLSGRYVALEIYPLSFREYLSFHDEIVDNRLAFVDKKLVINRMFEKYLHEGGFPKVVEYADPSQKRELLISYKDSVMLRDIVARYALKEYRVLEEIAAFLLSNSGISQNINKLKKSFGISYDMAKAYLEYLVNAYLLFEVPKFDYSLRKQHVNDKKYYSIDLGISNVLRVPNIQTRSSDLETVVYLELLRRGYRVYYYKTSSGWECDFVLERENRIVRLVQVCRSLSDAKTAKRELRVFAKTMQELQLKEVPCLVISEEQSRMLEYDGVQIEEKNIKEWLLI